MSKKDIIKKQVALQNKAFESKAFESAKTLISKLIKGYSHGEVLDCYELSQTFQEMHNSGDKNFVDLSKEYLSIFACRCGQNYPKYMLSCKHFICEACFGNGFNDIEPFLSTPLTFACPTCNYVHSDKELKNIAPEEHSRISALIKQEKLQRNLEQICHKCSVQKTISEFPQYSPCHSHKTCLECLADSYLTGSFTCPCGNPYKPKIDINKEKSICMSCKQVCYFVGDYLTSTCDSHLHCLECLKNSYSTYKCGVCGNFLDQTCIEKIKRKLWKQCQTCQNQFEAPLMVKKICCANNICVFCQGKDRQSCFKCLSCSQILNSYALEMVLEAQSAIDNYVP